MAKVIYCEEKRVPELSYVPSNENEPSITVSVLLQRVKVATVFRDAPRYLKQVSAIYLDYKGDEDYQTVFFSEELLPEGVRREVAIRAAITEFDRQVKDAEDRLATDRKVGEVKEADNGF